jgi:hypothetical protein
MYGRKRTVNYRGLNMRAIIATITIVWILMGVFTAGAMNADFRGDFPDLHSDPSHARHGCAQALGFGLLFGPFGFFLSPFMTGFFEHGWTLECRPTKKLED